MLLHTRDRSRWFIVDNVKDLILGPVEVAQWGGGLHRVDLESLVPFEVDASVAQVWIEQRVQEGLNAAGAVARRFVAGVRDESIANLPEYQDTDTAPRKPPPSPEEVFGEPPEQMANDREALMRGLGRSVRWITDQWRERAAEPAGDLKAAFEDLGRGIRAAVDEARRTSSREDPDG
ncbi:MAG: hypothetical protein AAGA48_11330 [Myxococcota bacterium]